jgi:hypothetical protein
VAREEGEWALLEVRQASEQSGPHWRRGRWTRGGRQASGVGLVGGLTGRQAKGGGQGGG